MTKDQALMYLKATVEAFDHVTDGIELDQKTWANLHTAIKEALAQHDSVQAKPEPEQEPVAWVWVNNKGWLNDRETPHGVCKSSPLYTHPPQRTWVGLTDKEKSELWKFSRAALPRYATYASLIEAKLKEKNT